ncbi:MAG: hypothetical protein KI786_18020 [Mameliella sp.]|nr:hypothetical protein [Phaeodactylibacter sp.]
MHKTVTHIVLGLKKCILLSCALLCQQWGLAQLANSNYSLRSKMGITISHEISEGAFDFTGKDGDEVDLFQQSTNFQTSSGLDCRAWLVGKLYLNTFVSNNFLKNISIKYNNLNELNSASANSGINARFGLSLNLQD